MQPPMRQANACTEDPFEASGPSPAVGPGLLIFKTANYRNTPQNLISYWITLFLDLITLVSL